MKKVKHTYYTYEVRDNYGNTNEYNEKSMATKMERIYAKERKVLSYIKPKGVTLVVSKDKSHYANVMPAFLGWNGVPLCRCDKDKGYEYYHSQFLFADEGRSIFGNTLEVIKDAYEFASKYCNYSFDRWRGAYRDRWDAKYGNNAAVSHVSAWTKGILWYNWDGKNFTTNDKKCKLTSEDFK